MAYARAAIVHGGSRNVLNIHIETRLLELGAGFAFVGRQVKHAQDNPSVGLLLCKSKNKVVAEYALLT